MEPLERVMRAVATRCQELGLRYFVTGSMASTSWGEPRFTQDVDIVVELPVAKAAAFCAAFPQPDWYADGLSARDAARTQGQFNIILVNEAVKADIMIPSKTPFDLSRLSRCVPIEMRDGCRVMFATPEDVILKKLDYFQQGGSEKHLRDIAGILKVLGPKIDLPYIERWAVETRVEAEWKLVKARLDMP